MQEQVIAAAIFEGPVNDAIVRLVGTYILDQLNTERAKVEALEQRLRQLDAEVAKLTRAWNQDVKFAVLDKDGNVIGLTFNYDHAKVLREAFRGATVMGVADV